MEPDALNAAVQSLADAKAEHGPLLQTIAADAGMAPATRAELMAHVHAEEAEKLARIQAALGATGGAAPRPSSSPRALTVGSLRPQDPTPAPGRFTVGSLRHR